MNINTKYYLVLNKLCFIAILVFCTSVCYAQTYGLKFNGQDVTLDERTELNLTPDGYFLFQDEFEISFDYKLDIIKAKSLPQRSKIGKLSLNNSQT